MTSSANPDHTSTEVYTFAQTETPYNFGVKMICHNSFYTKCFICLQLYLVAYDAERPRNKDRITAFITVLRNQGRPIWTFFVGDVSMREDLPKFNNVTSVKAEDTQDNVNI